jgi:hypothetical protein
MMSAPRARTTRILMVSAAAALAAGAAACKNETLSSQFCSESALNHRFDIPRPTVGKMLAFGLSPKTITYHYLDTRRLDSGHDTTEYTWDTAQTYFGLACLRFQTTDSVHIDSAAAFQLVLSGSNSAYMRRHLVTSAGTADDSIVGSIFYGCEGDGGTYRLQADSSLAFTWANGDAHWIFNPAALHKLRGDTIWSSLTQSAYGDSVRSTTRFAWVRAACGEGF